MSILGDALGDVLGDVLGRGVLVAVMPGALVAVTPETLTMTLGVLVEFGKES